MTLALRTDAFFAHDPSGVEPDLGVLAGAAEGAVELVLDGLVERTLPRQARLQAHAAARAMLDGGREVVLVAPVADASTTPDELIEAARELARYGVRWPGRVRFRAADSEGAPTDPIVAAAVAAGFLHLDDGPTTALLRLRDHLREAIAALPAGAPEQPSWERRARLLDDAPRRIVFEMMADAWLERAGDWPVHRMDKAHAVRLAVAQLGEEGKWLKAFRRYTFDDVRRMVVIPTWQCELRCAYCFIPKQDGRVMPPRTLERAVEMLLASERQQVELQFFGGEALIEYDNVRHAIDYAMERASAVGKQIGFILSSNGWSLTPDKLEWLKQRPVRLELSLDGDPRTQDRFRPARFRHEGSYANSIARYHREIVTSGIPHWVIMVVHPTNVDAMPDNFFHIADMGFVRIQINNMLGRVWTPAQKESFAKGLFTIGNELVRRWDAGRQHEFINMNHNPLAMRLNGEVTVDWDGTIFGGNQFLHETEHKQLFVVGHLDEHTNVDRYGLDFTDNNFLLEWGYRPHVTENNVEVGRIMASFIKWMRGRGYGPTGRMAELAIERPTHVRPRGTNQPRS
jgi:sulfatase maturation enzyme AslB (radical SAM superfamily)